MKDFTEEQQLRYRRNILLPEVGEAGQQKISSGKILIVGAGGLGSPVALYLAAAGVGTIGIIDGDEVDLTNLQRQIIHFTDDLNKAKSLSAKEKINRLNPDVQVVCHSEFLTKENAPGIIQNYDFVVSCTDSYDAKFLVNDSCVAAGKSFSHGSASNFEGQIFTHIPGTACYRCLFGAAPAAEFPPSQTGVLGAVAGMAGTIQATEALKFLTETGELLTNRLLSIDAKMMEFHIFKTRKSDKCPVCGRQSGG